MKIGMILDSTYPDDARVTNECAELLKNKHEIHVFLTNLILINTCVNLFLIKINSFKEKNFGTSYIDIVLCK